MLTFYPPLSENSSYEYLQLDVITEKLFLKDLQDINKLSNNLFLYFTEFFIMFCFYHWGCPK